MLTQEELLHDLSAYLATRIALQGGSEEEQAARKAHADEALAHLLLAPWPYVQACLATFPDEHRPHLLRRLGYHLQREAGPDDAGLPVLRGVMQLTGDARNPLVMHLTADKSQPRPDVRAAVQPVLDAFNAAADAFTRLPEWVQREVKLTVRIPGDVPDSIGLLRVSEERLRQATRLGFTPEHDLEEHGASNDLPIAALLKLGGALRARIATRPVREDAPQGDPRDRWMEPAEPWDDFEDTGDVEDLLVESAALIVAHLDMLHAIRLERQEQAARQAAEDPAAAAEKDALYQRVADADWGIPADEAAPAESSSRCLGCGWTGKRVPGDPCPSCGATHDRGALP